MLVLLAQGTRFYPFVLILSYTTFTSMKAGSNSLQLTFEPLKNFYKGVNVVLVLFIKTLKIVFDFFY